MARIYRRADSDIWWLDTRGLPGGRRESSGTKDKTLALEILGRKIGDRDDGRETGEMSFLAAEHAYLEERKGLNYKTLQADKLGFREFREVTGINRITTVKPEHLRQYRDYLLTRRGKFGTPGQAQANKLFRAVLKLLRHCEDEGWIKPQRWRKVKKPFPDTKPRKFRYTTEQTEKLFARYGLDWIGTTLRLGYYGGLRRGEIFHLEIRDVDFEREQIVLYAKPHWRPKGYRDGNPPSVVPAPDPLLNHLKHIFKGRKNLQFHDRVIVGCPSLQAMTRRIVKAIRELFHEGSLHTMRHTIIGHLLDAGESPAHVQKYARHKRIQQTMDYADVREEVARMIHKSIPVKG